MKIKKGIFAKGRMSFVFFLYDAYTMEPAREDSERLFFVAREKGKEV